MKKWTLEKLQEEALKYDTRTEFFKNSSGYLVASRRGILDQICSHMKESKTAPWTNEELALEAKKYDNRTVFSKKSKGAYLAAYKRGLLDQICSHMGYICHPWTNEELALEALKYSTVKEFQKNNNPAYQVARRRGLLKNICNHMKLLCRQWTDQQLQEEALKYNTKVSFRNANDSAYQLVIRRDIADKIFSHMKPATNTSAPETSLFDVIRAIFPKAQKLVDNKVKIEGKNHIHRFDIDIYVPELRKGIEFDGIFSHSFKGLKWGRPHWPDEDLKIYHELKDQWFLTKGIKILHIKEVDWNSNKQACIDKCLAFLGVEQKKVA